MLTALAPFDGETILPMADARVQVNLTADDTYHDAALESARDAAIAWVEDETGVSLQERQFLSTEDVFIDRIWLPRVPVSAVDDVSYYASDGTDTVLDSAEFYFGGNILSAAAGLSWPTAGTLPGAVRVTFTAGYPTAADIPFNLLAAVKLATAAFFEDRSNPDLQGARNVALQNRMMVA